MQFILHYLPIFIRCRILIAENKPNHTLHEQRYQLHRKRKTIESYKAHSSLKKTILEIYKQL